MLISYTGGPRIPDSPTNNETEVQVLEKNKEPEVIAIENKEQNSENVIIIKESEEDKSKIRHEVPKVIPTISIGSQIWMVENLKTETFQNNDKIFHAKTEKEWILAGDKKIPAWCFPNNDSKLGSNLGKLYNWYAVIDQRGLCPKEMMIPNKLDIESLINFLLSNGQNAKHIKSKEGWKRNGAGYDNYKLNSIPYSKRFPMGSFTPEGYTCTYWTRDENVHYTSFYWELRAESDEIKLGVVDKNSGFLIRCIKK
jgi:uncharacterized protein (TIGR02145 family)